MEGPAAYLGTVVGSRRGVENGPEGGRKWAGRGDSDFSWRRGGRVL